MRRGIGRAFQIASIFPSLTVEEILTAAVQAHMRNAERIMRQRFRWPDAATAPARSWTMLGLTDKAARRCRRASSHGDQKLLDIGLALALEPRVPVARRADGRHGAGRTLADDRNGPGIVGASEDDADLHRARHGYRVQDRADHPRALLRPRLGRRNAGEIRGNPEVIAAYLGTSQESRDS